MFETIVVPIDLEGSSYPGVRYAAEMARRAPGRFVVVHVLTSRDIDVTEVPHEPKPLRKAAEDSARERIARTLADVAAGVEAEVVIRFGDPAREILKVAGEHGADVIVITVKNRSRVGKLLMGSQAQEIILSADRPVICIPRD